MIVSNYKKIAVGGTFDKFHRGHKVLIKTAFDMADEVLIGITSDSFASNKNHDIEPCNLRVSKLRKFVNKFNKPYTIKEIFDVYGTADRDPDLDAIVVSEETEKSADIINQERRKNNLNPLDVIVISWVLAEDSYPISSTRIRKKEIDLSGKLL